MAVLIKKITGQWCKAGIIDKTDEDIYEYGLDLLIYTIVNITVILGSAAIIGKMTDSIALLMVILPLQSFGGGYHAKTHLRCFLIMYIGWWAVVFILPFITSAVANIMVGTAVVIVYWLAPVAHENVQMSDGQKMKIRVIVRLFVTVGAILCAILVRGIHYRFGIAMSAGLGVASLSMTVAHGKNKLIETH